MDIKMFADPGVGFYPELTGGSRLVGKDLIKALQEKEDELMRLQDQTRALQDEVRALRQAAKLVYGHEEQTPTHGARPTAHRARVGTAQRSPVRERGPISQPVMAREVLRSVGQPMRGVDVALAIASKYHTKIQKGYVLSMLYRHVKRKKWFRLEGPGTFGLLEWKGIEDPAPNNGNKTEEPNEKNGNII